MTRKELNIIESVSRRLWDYTFKYDTNLVIIACKEFLKQQDELSKEWSYDYEN